MYDHKNKNVDLPKTMVLSAKRQDDGDGPGEMKCFAQTPSDGAFSTLPQVSPQEVFIHFTASIIREDKVFVR